MQSVSSRIWTRIAVFISYGDNDYATGTSIRIFRWAIKIMAFYLINIIYVKGNTIQHVDALSRLRFQCENGEEHENSEDRIIQWVDTDVLSRKTLSRET